MMDESRDDEARERARARLAERTARLRGEDAQGAAGPSEGAGRRVRETTFPSRRGAVEGSPSRASHAGKEGTGPFFAFAGASPDVSPSPLARRVALAAAAVVLVALLAMGLRGCSGCAAQPEPAHPSEDAQAEDPSEPQPASSEPVDVEALAAVLEPELASALAQAAEDDEDAAWTAAHPDAYAADGSEVQRKLLKLAAEEPEARPFLRAFPDLYPAEEAGSCDEVERGSVPRLYQWDERWGATVYSSTAFALTGCCPTSLAMVYQGLTGENDLSPYDMGQLAQRDGYMTEFDGTDQTFLEAEAPGLGLSCEVLAADAESLSAALSDGAVVVCNVGPGDFTEGGHFFVITGIGEDGGLVVNDPYSAVRSARTWDADTVLGQTKALWAFRLA